MKGELDGCLARGPYDARVDEAGDRGCAARRAAGGSGAGCAVGGRDHDAARTHRWRARAVRHLDPGGRRCRGDRKPERRAGAAQGGHSGDSARLQGRPARPEPVLLRLTAAPYHGPAVRAAPSPAGDVACERPADKRVGMPVPHAMLGLQVPHDGHVLVESAARDDLLPLRDRAPVLLLDGREVGCRTHLRPWRRMLGHGDALPSRAPVQIRRAGRTDLIARRSMLWVGASVRYGQAYRPVAATDSEGYAGSIHAWMAADSSLACEQGRVGPGAVMKPAARSSPRGDGRVGSG